ncbi:MAG: MinD/ParA family protein [Dissulfurimicrobium sp.]|uniref:MinD/ParA family protein n=1 Tax=Dissulfurimicrobium sp. TaxID=2022436 RepID=UPI004049174F
MEEFLAQKKAGAAVGYGANSHASREMAANTAASPRVLSFSSGKGGVGKTSIVVNLAIALAKLGQKVMVLDADLGLANIDVILGLTPEYTIDQVFSGRIGLKDVLIEGPSGILILPAGSGTTELINLGESEKLFLLNEIEELGNDIDLMLIDNAAGISENVMYFNLAAQQRVVVVTPEPTSITDAYALIKVMVNKYRANSFSILINMAKDNANALKVFRQLTSVTDRFLGTLAIDYLGFIPKDDTISMAVCRQKAVLEAYPDSSASKCIRYLAKHLLISKWERPADGNIKFFWRHLLRI